MAGLAHFGAHAGTPPRAPVNLSDAATRERLTPAAIEGVRRVAELWKLTASETSALLGDMSERSWYRLKKGEARTALSQDELTRASALIGIYKGLHLLFSDPLADEWVKLPNRGPLFGGRTPLMVMIEGGIPAMLDVRRHVDALRGGL